MYSNEVDESYYRELQENPNIVYGGSIPYKLVLEKMEQSDITVIVEGFEEKDIELSRYSLSTKAADALTSGVAIVVYGSDECGIIEYMRSTNAAAVCSDKNYLQKAILELIQDVEMQKRYYAQQIVMTEEHHNIRKSCSVSEQVVSKAIENYKKRD